MTSRFRYFYGGQTRFHFAWMICNRKQSIFFLFLFLYPFIIGTMALVEPEFHLGLVLFTARKNEMQSKVFLNLKEIK